MAYYKAGTKKTAGFRQIEADLKANAFTGVRVALFYGSEQMLSDTYAKRIKELFINPASEMIDFVKIDGDREKADDIRAMSDEVILACDTMPMFSEKRVVHLAHLKGDEKSLATIGAKALAAYLEDIPPSCILIITSDSVSKRSALYKAAEKAGRVYEFSTLERADAKSFIKGRFRRAGLSAADNVINEILDVSGYLDPNAVSDLSALENSVSNIAEYAKPKTAVDMSDVAACIGSSIETNVFALLDAASAGRKGDAMELLQNITYKDDNPFGLLALLQSQFEMMLAYREMKELRGMDIPAIARELEIKSEFRLKKAAGFAAKYSIERLTELLSRLYRVEKDIKTGLYAQGMALTMFIAEL